MKRLFTRDGLGLLNTKSHMNITITVGKNTLIHKHTLLWKETLLLQSAWTLLSPALAPTRGLGSASGHTEGPVFLGMVPRSVPPPPPPPPKHAFELWLVDCEVLDSDDNGVKGLSVMPSLFIFWLWGPTLTSLTPVSFDGYLLWYNQNNTSLWTQQ